jgi:lipid A disaccharide synthetase
VPEIIQDQATPEALAQAMENLLNNQDVRDNQIESFRQQRARLKRNTPALITQALQPFLDGKSHAV